MKTVEWMGIKLTVAPVNTVSCGVPLPGGDQLICRLDSEKAPACRPFCPGGANILLEGADLGKYLAAKLTGDLP